jgi:hypothetical protein
VLSSRLTAKGQKSPSRVWVALFGAATPIDKAYAVIEQSIEGQTLASSGLFAFTVASRSFVPIQLASESAETMSTTV